MQAALADGWADPQPIVRRGPAQRGAAGCRPGGDDRRVRSPAGRADLPARPAPPALQLAVLGEPGRPPASGHAAGAFGGRAFRGVQGRDWHVGRGGAVPGGAGGQHRPVGIRTAFTGSGTGHRARPPRRCRPPTTRSAPGNRSRRWPPAWPPRAWPSCPWWWTPATKAGLRPSRRASASVFIADARLWGGPGGVGFLMVRSGTRWRAPVPVDGAEPAAAGRCRRPPRWLAAAASLRASGPSGRPGRPLRPLLDRMRRATPVRLLPDTDGARPAGDRLPHLSPSPACTSRARRSERTGPARILRLVRLLLHLGHPDASHVLVAMGALTSRQRPALAASRRWGGPTRGCGPAARAPSPTVRAADRRADSGGAAAPSRRAR